MVEIPVVFDCDGDSLVGVVSRPVSAAKTAVLIIVGGPQYRIGSHRQFVQLARSLASAGFAAMRFDLRGMGDSEGDPRRFYRINRDIACAIDALLRVEPTVVHVVLWGLCGGASAALLYLHELADARVRGLVLVNPWVRDEVTQARTRVKHYYLQRLASREFWKKLARGDVAFQALTEFTGNLKRAFRPVAAATQQATRQQRPFQHRMADAWATFDGPTLLVLSGNDFTAQEFIEATAADSRWARSLKSSRVKRLDIENADHTFSAPAWQSMVETGTIQWLKDRCSPTSG